MISRKRISILIGAIFGLAYCFFGNAFPLLYGVLIGAINLQVAEILIARCQSRVSKNPGQALKEMSNSIAVRASVVIGLLVAGLKNPVFDETQLIIGFVIGQILYFFGQLSKITKGN